MRFKVLKAFVRITIFTTFSLLLKENMYQDKNDVPKAKWILCSRGSTAALGS